MILLALRCRPRAPDIVTYNPLIPRSFCARLRLRTTPQNAARNRWIPHLSTHSFTHGVTHAGAGMATVRRLPSGRWRCEVYKRGIRRSAVLDTKARAESWGQETERQLESGDSGRTFEAAADRYLREVMPAKRGSKRETFRLRAIAAHFSELRLAEIDAPEISRWRDKRSREVSPWSVLREATILKSLFRVARDEWQWMESDPFRGVRMPKDPAPRHQRWGWREIRRVLRFLGYRRRTPQTKYQEVALAFMIALSTGLRASEVLQVAPERIRSGVLILQGTKTDPHAKVPLTPRGARQCALVRRWTIDAVLLDAVFRKARDACLVRDLRFHDARASALTWLARRVDVLTLSRISRHKDLRILGSTYYRETAEEIARRLK